MMMDKLGVAPPSDEHLNQIASESGIPPNVVKQWYKTMRQGSRARSMPPQEEAHLDVQVSRSDDGSVISKGTNECESECQHSAHHRRQIARFGAFQCDKYAQPILERGKWLRFFNERGSRRHRSSVTPRPTHATVRISAKARMDVRRYRLSVFSRLFVCPTVPCPTVLRIVASIVNRLNPCGRNNHTTRVRFNPHRPWVSSLVLISVCQTQTLFYILLKAFFLNNLYLVLNCYFCGPDEAS